MEQQDQTFDAEIQNGGMQEKLPNATISMVLGIISFICCCFGGFGGVILSGIALFLANRDKKRYAENPEGYSNYSQVKTARIIAIIGLILGAIVFIWSIINIIAVGGWDAYMDQIREAVEKAQAAQQ